MPRGVQNQRTRTYEVQLTLVSQSKLQLRRLCFWWTLASSASQAQERETDTISILMQGMVDHAGHFTDIYIGWPGRVHDARVFINSSLYRRGESGRLFPNWKKTIAGKEIPLLVLGDPAYPLLSWLMKSFPDNGSLSVQQKTFNYRLSANSGTLSRATLTWNINNKTKAFTVVASYASFLPASAKTRAKHCLRNVNTMIFIHVMRFQSRLRSLLYLWVGRGETLMHVSADEDISTHIHDYNTSFSYLKLKK